MASHSAVKIRPTTNLARVNPVQSKLQKPSNNINDLRKNSLINAKRPDFTAPEKLGDRVPTFAQL